MIKSIKIQNILSHKETHLHFHKGVNMIVGPSDQGKSAFISSPRWFATLRPSGDAHRSWWEGEMLCRIELWDGSVAELRRKAVSQYILNPDSGDPTVFKAFGSTPPDEIIEFMNMDLKINFQQQLERGVPIFLISESPGDVAKFFNRVAGLYKIDQTRSNATSSVNSSEKDHKNILSQILEKGEELEKYDGLVELGGKVAHAIETQKNTEESHQNLTDIAQSVSLIASTEEFIQLQKKKTKIKGKVLKAIKLRDSIIDGKSERFTFQAHFQKISDTEEVLDNISTGSEILPKVDRGLSIHQALRNMDQAKKELQDLTKDVNFLKKRIGDLKEDKASQEKEFKELMPETCPLCGKQGVKND